MENSIQVCFIENKDKKVTVVYGNSHELEQVYGEIYGASIGYVIIQTGNKKIYIPYNKITQWWFDE